MLDSPSLNLFCEERVFRSDIGCRGYRKSSSISKSLFSSTLYYKADNSTVIVNAVAMIAGGSRGNCTKFTDGNGLICGYSSSSFNGVLTQRSCFCR